ncbi:MAG TPA: glycerophosphodiester phosphodiesterase [Spirochaetota bacterium]|nr:glycerophosphodiester phosphodiesterase [Spirochaetota bacterium]HRZ26000.1 glycerophosphodiester phosphodiesterase [Spirochaetota bacterium]
MLLKKNFFIPTRKFEIIAHRGSPREYPENTAESFARALEIWSDAVLELDVWRTADERIVVMHDGVLDASTDGSGPVGAATLAEIRELEAGHNISFDGGKSFPFRGRGFRVAEFGELLRKFPRARMSVDIKYDSIEFARSVLDCIEENDAASRVIVGSFHGRIVSWVRRANPVVATSFSKWEIIRFMALQRLGLAFLAGTKGDAFMVPEYTGADKPEYLGRGVFQGLRLVSRGFIRAAHRAGVPVFVWTVNRRDNMDRLIAWGVDGIVSDRPAELVDAALSLLQGR